MPSFNASLVPAGRLAFVAGISLTMAQGLANRLAPADLVLEGGRIYTVDAARSVAAALAVRDGRVEDPGSIEVGKSADFVLVDRDILALADGGHPAAIADTRVLATWFRGTRVYAGATR